METETLGIVLGAVLPLYPVLFTIHQKIGKYDEIVEQFREFREEYGRFRENCHGA